jgi:flagellar protein FlgJ
MATPLALDPRISGAVAGNVALARSSQPGSVSEKARKTATEFEAVFLNQMFQSMFTDIGKEGPLGGGAGTGTGIWRSFLTDEYAKNFARAGGIGLADHVYRALMERQAARAA